jgi:hypothetical protein
MPHLPSRGNADNADNDDTVMMVIAGTILAGVRIYIELMDDEFYNLVRLCSSCARHTGSLAAVSYPHGMYWAFVWY